MSLTLEEYKNKRKNGLVDLKSNKEIKKLNKEREENYSTESEPLTLERYKEMRKNNLVDFDSDGASEWFKSANNYLDNVSKTVQPTNYNWASSQAKALSKNATDLKNQSGQVKLYIESLKGTPVYDTLSKQFETYQNALSQSSITLDNISDFASQFDNENKYNKAIKEIGYSNKHSSLKTYGDYINAALRTDDEDEKQWLKDKSYEVGDYKDYKEYYDYLQKQLDSLSSTDYSNFSGSETERQNRLDSIENKKSKLTAEMSEVKGRMDPYRPEYKYDEISDKYKYVTKEPDYKLNNMYGDGSFEASVKSAENLSLKNSTVDYNNADSIYEFINYTQGNRNVGDESLYAFGYNNPNKPLEFMTEDEAKIFNYLYNKGEKDKAKEYFDGVYPLLEKRLSEASEKAVVNVAKDNPVQATAHTFISNLLSTSGAVKDILASRTGNDIDVYSPEHTASKVTRDIRQTVADEHTSKFLGGAELPIIGNVGSFLYNAGTSTADSVINIGIAALTGNASSAVSSILMGSQAATSGIIDAKERGLSDDQAVLLGIINGTVEGITEKYSIDALFDNPKNIFSKAIKNKLARSAIAEGSEEMAADVLDTIADVIVASDKSEFKTKIQSYVDDGMTQAQAFGQALLDFGQDTIRDGISGALSGVALSSGVSAKSNLANYHEGKSVKKFNNTNELIKIGKYYKNTDASKLANKVEKQSDRKKGASNTKVGQLRSAIIQEAGSTAQEIDNFTESYIKGSKLSSEEKAIVTKVAMGEELTDSESNEVDTNSNLSRVIKALPTQTNIHYGNYAQALSSTHTRLPEVNIEDFEKIENSHNMTEIEALNSYAKSLNMDNDTTLIFKEGYKENSKMDIDDYAREFIHFNNCGKLIMPYENITSNVQLNEKTRITAYEQGIEAFKDRARLNNELTKRQKQWQERTKGYSEGTVKLTNINESTLNKEQKQTIEYVSQFAKFGLNVEFKESTPDSHGDFIDPNGSYNSSTHTVTLDINARRQDINDALKKGAIHSTFSHELTHISEHSNNEYMELRQAVQKAVGARAWDVVVKNQLAIFEKSQEDLYNSMSDFERTEYASKEALAEFCSDMLKHSDILEKMAKESPKATEKLITAIKNIIKKIRNFLKGSEVQLAEAKILEETADDLQAIVDKWDKAVIAGIKNQNAKQAVKSDSVNSDVQYSIKRTRNIDYIEQVDNILNGNYNGSDSLYIGMPSQELLNTGLANYPFAMNQSDLRKSHRETARNKHRSSHGISKETLYELPKLINEASIFVDNDKRVSIITDKMMNDTKGQKSLILVGVLQNSKIDNDTVNLVKSIYPYDDILQKLNKYAKAGNLVITNKSKVEKILVAIGVNPSEASNLLNLAKDTLTQNNSIVNNNSIQNSKNNSDQFQVRDTSNDIYSENFKEWFGDWQNDPENASKVVDEDGKPLIVYHGTLNQEEKETWNPKSKSFDTEYRDFTIFKKLYDEQEGYFFSPDYDNAGSYGSKVYATYLSMKNPLIIDCNDSHYNYIEHNGLAMDTYEWAQYAKKNRYDGVIFKNIRDGAGFAELSKPTTDYVVFKSNQIKSATDNIGTYDVNNPDIRYQIRNITDDSGNKLNNVVVLDTDLFKGVKPRHWGKIIHDFVYNNLAGKQITVTQDNGNSEIIEFAKANERVQKEGAKNSHRVIDKLARKSDNLSKLAVAHSIEIIEVAKTDSYTDEHLHQWLDENGWEIKKAKLMDKKGNIYEVTLNIAKTKDNRKILYDINKIKNIGHGDVSSNAEKIGKRDSHINPNVLDNGNIISKESQEENINTQYQYGRGNNLSDREILAYTESGKDFNLETFDLFDDTDENIFTDNNRVRFDKMVKDDPELALELVFKSAAKTVKNSLLQGTTIIPTEKSVQLALKKALKEYGVNVFSKEGYVTDFINDTMKFIADVQSDFDNLVDFENSFEDYIYKCRQLLSTQGYVYDVNKALRADLIFELNACTGGKLVVPEHAISEIESTYGSFANYRKKMFKRGINVMTEATGRLNGYDTTDIATLGIELTSALGDDVIRYNGDYGLQESEYGDTFDEYTGWIALEKIINDKLAVQQESMFEKGEMENIDIAATELAFSAVASYIKEQGLQAVRGSNNAEIKRLQKANKSLKEQLSDIKKAKSEYKRTEKTLNDFKDTYEKYQEEYSRLQDINEQLKKADESTRASLTEQKQKLEDSISEKDKLLSKLEKREVFSNVVEYERQNIKRLEEERYAKRLEKERERAQQKFDKLRKDKNKRIREEYQKGIKKAQEAKKEIREAKTTAEYVDKIKRLSKKFTQMALRPTDNSYVPPYLVKPFSETCRALTEAINLNNGTKASTELRKLSDKLKELNTSTKEEYIEFNDSFSNELFNDITYLCGVLDNLVPGKKIQRKTGSERTSNGITLDEAKGIYTVMSDIYNAIHDATIQLGREDAKTNYRSGSLVIEQTNALTEKDMARLPDTKAMFMSAERMAKVYTGYNHDSELYQHVKELEKGLRKQNFFRMEAEKLITEYVEDWQEKYKKDKEKKKAYERSLNEVVDVIYKNNNGKEQTVKMTRMQGLQILMSWSRELQPNSNLAHMQKGGVVLYDPESLAKGKLDKAYDNKSKEAIGVNLDLIYQIENKMTDFEEGYRKVAEKFFNELARDAVNETSRILKHRDVATSAYYIPFSVDTNHVTKEIDGVKYDSSIENRGMLKSLEVKAPQPLLITGLNLVIDHHIKDVSEIYGLAVPIRNFKKMWNIQQYTVNKNYLGEDQRVPTTSVREALENKWGSKCIDFFEQLVADLQASRNTHAPTEKKIDKVVKKIRGNMITSALVASVSVVIKQAASYVTAGYVLDYRALGIALRKYGWGRMLSPKEYKAICDEIDAHTATHYMRRKGLSMMEIADMHSTMFDKLPTAANPAKWIQGMDCLTTAVHWVACKEQVNRDYQKNQMSDNIGSEAYWQEVANLYDTVIEQTQPMYDVMHRGELQKSSSEIMKSVFMFKTQPFQNAGILYDAIHECKFNKDKETLGKAVSSQIMSAVTFSLMTLLAAVIQHKPNHYKDENDEVTLNSMMFNTFIDTMETLLTVVIPIGGSEIDTMINNRLHNTSYDVMSESVIDTFNEAVKSYNNLIDLSTDLIESSQFGYVDVDKIKYALFDCVTKTGTLVKGLPLKNLWNIVNGILSWGSDIMNLQNTFAGSTGGRRSSEYAHSYGSIYASGDFEKAKKQLDTLYQEKYDKQIAEGKSSSEAYKYANTAVRTALTNAYKLEYQKAFLKEDTNRMQEISKMLSDSRYMVYKNKLLSETLSDWRKSAKDDVNKSYMK